MVTAGGGRRGRPPKLGPAERQLIVAAVALGATLTAAAALVDVTKTTVINTSNRDPEFAEELRRARVRHANPDVPLCTACGQPELTLTPTGAACTCCGTAYRLVPLAAAPTNRPAPHRALYDLTAPPAPLAQAG